MKLYKGFDKNMKCHNFQYEEGKTYTYPGTPKLCDEGFHACEVPLDCLKYYAPADGSIHIIKQKTEGSPAATSKYKSTAATSGDYSTATTSGYYSTASTSGDYSTAATSGGYSTASTSGDYSTAASSGVYSTAATSGEYSTAATSGYKSTAATSGDFSTAATSGDKSTAVVEGKESIALAGGLKSKAKGALGCWLVLAERDDEGHILGVKAVKVDGVHIKPDTFYILKDGEEVRHE